MHEGLRILQHRIFYSPGIYGALAVNLIPIIWSTSPDTRLLRCHGTIARAIRGVNWYSPNAKLDSVCQLLGRLD